MDPVHDQLVRELRQVRKASGLPSIERLSGKLELIESLGLGNIERAFEVLTGYWNEYGADAESDIGAFFYTAGWRVGLETLDQRQNRYAFEFRCDPRTALRRSNRGMEKLAAIIRDRSENSRPWAALSMFQSGSQAQVVIDFNLAYESWRPPEVQLNDEELTGLQFAVKPAEAPGRYSSRIILPLFDLDLAVEFGEPMARLRVLWPMPIWPVWHVMAWTADPRILVRLRTFRQRAAEVSYEWWLDGRPCDVGDLARDARMWIKRDSADAAATTSATPLVDTPTSQGLRE